MKRSLIIGGAALVLAACAIGPTDAQKEELSKIHSVGVISLIGDQFHMVHVNFSVVDNRDKQYSVENWRVDEKTEALIKSLLERSGKFQTVWTGYPRTHLYSARSATYIDLDTEFKKLEPELRAAISSRPVDALLVLTKRVGGDGIGQSSASLEGIGLYSRAIGGNLGAVAAYASYEITVVDGSTLKPIVSEGGYVTQVDPILRVPLYRYPFRSLHLSFSSLDFMNTEKRDIREWTTDFTKLTGDDEKTIKEALAQVLNASIPDTLRGLSLISQ